jgi:hypothetical protein
MHRLTLCPTVTGKEEFPYLNWMQPFPRSCFIKRGVPICRQQPEGPVVL